MRINDLNQITINTTKNRQRTPEFKGNIALSVKKVKLNESEISKISGISGFYKQLNMIFKAAGDYFNEIFRNSIRFISPAGKSGHIFKNVFEQGTVRDIEIEKAENQEDTLIFTLGKDNPTAKVVVSKDCAELLTDSDLSEEITASCLNEFDRNRNKLFDETFDREKKALNLIQEIINKEIEYDFNLNSPDEVQKVVKRFIDEKKRLALLVDLININKFWSGFKFEKGEKRSLEEGAIDGKGISFRFSQLENNCFDGMQITVTDEINGTKQGFVAGTDGEIFKTEIYKKEDFVPRKIWHIRKLMPLSPSDYENPDLNYMFKYAHSHTDRLYRSMLNMFFEDNKISETFGSLSKRKREYINKLLETRLDRIEKFNSRIRKRVEEKIEGNTVIQNGPLNEDRAKIAKIYNINEESLNIIKKMAYYSSRLSKTYLNRVGYQRNELNEKSGFIRRKSQNGIIFKDILTNKSLLLGLAQYLVKPTSQELVSFGIFDKRLTELARFKVTNNGEAKLLVRPNTTTEFAESIEQVLRNEMKQGLYEKLVSKLETAIYYHENKIKVDNYMDKSCRPLTLEQAVKEMITPKENYKFDTSKIITLKNDLDSIKEIYREHQAPAYKWQKIYFPEIKNPSQKYMYGRIDKLGINYEFIFIDNEKCSGLRILTRDENGNFKKGYVIDFQGNANKLIVMPADGDYRHLYVDKTNFSLLDSEAVKEEHLDAIFESICKDTEAYSRFCRKCIDEMTDRRQISRKELLAFAAEYKPEVDRLELEQNPFVQSTRQSRKSTQVDKQQEAPQKAAKATAPKLIKLKRKEKSPAYQEKRTLKNISPQIETKEEQPQIEIPSANIKPVYDVNPRMLKPSGKFKDFMYISLKDVAEQFDKIFQKPYEERSPHLIHEVLDSGRIFTGRFSVTAPDGATITVSKVKTGDWVDHIYYSMRIAKGSEIVYLNIDPESGFILQGRGHISKEDFLKENPLCKNLSDYLAELFDYRPGEKRKTKKFQIIKTPKILLEEQSVKDFKKASTSSAPKFVRKEFEEEFDDFDK